MGNVCIENGTVYGPGSAMGASRFCEYCYCIGGQQTCIKPKCLLNLEGCTPIFEEHSCCPVRYNCTGFYEPTSTTTESPDKWRNECTVAGVRHEEGSKILSVGHSACDNCYCIRGIVRCEPLSCAPAILGCTPVIKPGQCCPESYNCNDTVDIQPEAYYGNYPIVSKEYAKLRKEVQLPSKSEKRDDSESAAYYITAESTTKTQNSLDIVGITRHISNPSTIGPFYYNTLGIKKKTQPILDVRTRPSTAYKKNISFGTTNYEFQSTRYKRPLLTTILETTTAKYVKSVTVGENTTSKQVRSSDYETDLLKIVDSFFDNEINLGTESEVQSNATDITTNITTDEPSTINLTDAISTLISTLTNDFSTTLETSSTLEEDISEMPQTTTKFKPVVNSTALTTIVTTTDCIKNNKTTKIAQRDDENELEDKYEQTTEGTETTSTLVTTTDNDFTEVDLESKVKVDTLTPNPYKKLSSDIEAILNSTITNHKDYEDYDYNEPTLPPSLPNLKIIPFVAADALDGKSHDQDNSLYSDRLTESPPYSLFSPPTKTEGGFVPKEPPIMPEYYDKGIGVTAVTLQPGSIVTKPVKTHEHNCIADRREIQHRETVTVEDCIICVCFFGNIICQQPPCPAPAPGCSISHEHKVSNCCPHIICDEDEAPTLVLDRIDITSNPQEIITVAEGLPPTPDAFRDVIRTKPAPNLQSLMGDMPYLGRHSTTQKMNQTEVTSTQTPKNLTSTSDKEELSFNNILEFLLYNRSTPAPDTDLKNDTNSTAPQPEYANGVDSKIGVGLLKLAGCNIYGRMYRVGRIISELSGPCMECRCTEVGVQCTPLKC